MSALLDLASRVEAATEPDRRLDVEIAVATDWRWPDWEEGESTARGQAEKHGLDWLVNRTECGMASMWRHIPRYSESLDAAMTLVPEGLSVTLYAHSDNAHCDIYAGHPSKGLLAEVEMVATAPLALCAAALRVRASQ